MELCIAICNNTVALNAHTKALAVRLQGQGGLTEDETEKALDVSKLQKRFGAIASTAKDLFFVQFFGRTASLFKRGYADAPLEDTLRELVGPAQEPARRLHDSFARKVWKSLLDLVVFYYFNAFIIACGKAKRDDLRRFTEKLTADRELVASEFDGCVFESALNAALQPFSDMLDFMEASPLGALGPC